MKLLEYKYTFAHTLDMSEVNRKLTETKKPKVKPSRAIVEKPAKDWLDRIFKR